MELCSLTQDDNEEVICLKREIERLQKELQSEKDQSENALKRLEKAEYERDSSRQYADSLKEDVKDLSKKLADERCQRKVLEKTLESYKAQQIEVKTAKDVIVINDGDVDKEESSTKPLDLVSELKSVAEQAVAQSSFVYDENTGLYFDWSTGYYYDSSTCLYYDHNTGTYYYYDGESQAYVFHSQIDLPVNASGETKSKKNRKERRKEKREMEERRKEERSNTILIESENESEDGEIKGSDTDKESIEGSDHSDADTDEAEEFPPCIRAIVLSSPKLPPGSLTIFTCLGGTIGREKGRNHLIRISDVEVSKDHARIFYDKLTGQYHIKDLGSQNGTYINEHRLSEPKNESESQIIMHGDTLRLGGTVILLHIHCGTDTCDKCEPGQVQAELAMIAEKNKEEEEEKEEGVVITSVKSKDTKLGPEARRRKELKKLKQLYLLENTDYSSRLDVAQGGKYRDRADTRRLKVGSDTPVQLSDDAPSSVHRPIASGNKGRRLLEKMGWKDGEGLGKEKKGRKVPVLAELREGQKGLGSGVKRQLDNPTGSSNSFHWDKARERFKAVCLLDKQTNSVPSGAQNADRMSVDSGNCEDIFAD